MKSLDLSYLKKLVFELENEVNSADVSKESSVLTDAEHELVEQERRLAFSRAAGIAMSIAQEGTMLMYDTQKLIASSFVPQKSSKEDVSNNALSNFLKLYKGGNGSSEN